MRKTLYLIFAVACAAALAGCNSNAPPEVPDADLVGTLWTLQSIEVPGEPDIIVGSTTTVNIQFSKDNRLEGISFCNAYIGIYVRSENNEISIDSLITTLRGCESAEQSHGEATYYWALPLVFSYEIEGNKLRLYFDNGPALKYLYVE